MTRVAGSGGMLNLKANRMLAKIRGRSTTKAPGFTILELMVTVAIISIIGGIAVLQYTEYIEKARNVRAMAEIRTISEALEVYYHDHDSYPSSLAEVGFASLFDPWGSPYRYLNIQAATGGQQGSFRRDRFLVPINTDYDLYSMGKDRKSASPLTASQSQDDIIRANDGGYIGLASNF